MQEVPTLTDHHVFYLLVDATVACVFVCNRAHRSKIFHDSGAENGGELIEFRGTQIDFYVVPEFRENDWKFQDVWHVNLKRRLQYFKNPVTAWILSAAFHSGAHRCQLLLRADVGYF